MIQLKASRLASIVEIFRDSYGIHNSVKSRTEVLRELLAIRSQDTQEQVADTNVKLVAGPNRPQTIADFPLSLSPISPNTSCQSA